MAVKYLIHLIKFIEKNTTAKLLVVCTVQFYIVPVVDMDSGHAALLA